METNKQYIRRMAEAREQRLKIYSVEVSGPKGWAVATVAASGERLARLLVKEYLATRKLDGLRVAVVRKVVGAFYDYPTPKVLTNFSFVALTA